VRVLCTLHLCGCVNLFVKYLFGTLAHVRGKVPFSQFVFQFCLVILYHMEAQYAEVVRNWRFVEQSVQIFFLGIIVATRLLRFVFLADPSIHLTTRLLGKSSLLPPRPSDDLR